MAVVLLDVEGEYTHLHEPTDDKKMLASLEGRGTRNGRHLPADANDALSPRWPRHGESASSARRELFAAIRPPVALCGDGNPRPERRPAAALPRRPTTSRRNCCATSTSSPKSRRCRAGTSRPGAGRIRARLSAADADAPARRGWSLPDDHAEKPPKENRGRKGKKRPTATRSYRAFRRRSCKHLQKGRRRCGIAQVDPRRTSPGMPFPGERSSGA